MRRLQLARRPTARAHRRQRGRQLCGTARAKAVARSRRATQTPECLVNAGRGADTAGVEIETKRIDNAASLTDIFGRWPSFHDAEIHSIRLDRGAAEPPSLEADVHVFEMTSDVTPDGFYVLKNHMLVTLGFAGIDQLELDGFNQQNVLADLVLRDISSRQLDVLRWEVEFDSSFGVGARFLCERISVLRALPFSPQSRPPASTGTRSAARPFDAPK